MPLRFSNLPLYCQGHTRFYIRVLHLTLENAITAEWEAQIRAGGTGAEAPGSGQGCLALCVQGRRGGQKTPRARKSILSLCKRRKTA